MDASQEGMGMVLYQLGLESDQHVLEYASAKFGPAAYRYHMNEPKCPVVVWAVDRYHHYLKGRAFTLRTDSQCLKWLDSVQGHKSKFIRCINVVTGHSPAELLHGQNLALPNLGLSESTFVMTVKELNSKGEEEEAVDPKRESDVPRWLLDMNLTECQCEQCANAMKIVPLPTMLAISLHQV
ncbi:uncharacterized protein LOC134533474 [Bacillus rossius redtenbacheri]|uniref:uncharacterized protein LOC134533474 n=1 Tax=Bacillus rossius redtenbacheri TaxID=93214 RepID=UPI002FDDEF71